MHRQGVKDSATVEPFFSLQLDIQVGGMLQSPFHSSSFSLHSMLVFFHLHSIPFQWCLVLHVQAAWRSPEVYCVRNLASFPHSLAHHDNEEEAPFYIYNNRTVCGQSCYAFLESLYLEECLTCLPMTFHLPRITEYFGQAQTWRYAKIRRAPPNLELDDHGKMSGAN